MAPPLLLHDVCVQEGIGAASRPHQSVLIDGDRIRAVLPATQAPLDDPSVEVRHLPGRTVMPGMTLGHSHIAYIDVVTARDTMFKYSLPELTLRAAENATRMVQLGYTGLVGAGSVAGMDIVLKAAVAQGRLVGPRITACSRDLMVSGPAQRRRPDVAAKFPADLMPVVDSEAEMVARTQLEIDEGAQIIKTFSSGDDTYPNARSEEILYTLAELQAVVRTARPRGVMVRAHSRGIDGIRNAITAEVDVIDHASYADEGPSRPLPRRGSTSSRACTSPASCCCAVSSTARAPRSSTRSTTRPRSTTRCGCCRARSSWGSRSWPATTSASPGPRTAATRMSW